MQVTQVYELMNTVTGEILGETGLVAEDLSNVVDVGTQLFNASSVDNYVKTLVNHIGKVIFVNRPYSGSVPSVLMDGWEFGSVLEKISAGLPEASENETWGLEDGETYNQDIFYQPKVSVKFFNQRVTFEVDRSFTERQVKESFSNAQQLNAFISMLYNAVDRSMTVKVDALIMRTINNMIGETVYSDYESGGSLGSLTGKSGVKAVNLLYEYNTANTTTLTADSAITDPDFIRYAAYRMGLYERRLARMSNLFNIGGESRFTPPDLLHVVLLADFSAAADVFLQSDTFHDEFTALPRAEVVPYWQGTGEDYGFTNTSSINITTADGHAVNMSGILGVMFDRDALGVANLDRRVQTHWNAKAEFFNNFFKFDAGFFNDTNENFVVFFVA